jgi:hypothetical protein
VSARTAPKPTGPVLKRILVGRAFSSAHLEHTLLPKVLALPVFASDALSSVAYATGEIFIQLAIVSTVFKGLVALFAIIMLAQAFSSYTFWNKQRRSQVQFEIHSPTGETARQKVLCPDDPKDIVEAALRNREAGVKRQRNLLLCLFPWIIDIQPDHVASRLHQSTDRAIAEFENALYDVMLRFFKHARFGPLLHHDFDFFLRDRWFFRRLQTYRFQNEARGSSEQAHHRRAETRQEIHDTGHRNSDAFRIVQSQPLWNEFAEHECDISKEHHDDCKCYRFTVWRDARDLVQSRRQTVRERSLAVGSH